MTERGAGRERGRGHGRETQHRPQRVHKGLDPIYRCEESHTGSCWQSWVLTSCPSPPPTHSHFTGILDIGLTHGCSCECVWVITHQPPYFLTNNLTWLLNPGLLFIEWDDWPEVVCDPARLLPLVADILACSGCYHEVLRGGALEITDIYFSQPKGWKSESKVPAPSGSGESSLLGCWWTFLSLWLYPDVTGSREFSGVPFIRALIPFTRTPPSWHNHLPKAPPPTSTTLAVRISTYELGETSSP